jgi:hypothetical protein
LRLVLLVLLVGCLQQQQALPPLALPLLVLVLELVLLLVWPLLALPHPSSPASAAPPHPFCKVAGS